MKAADRRSWWLDALLVFAVGCILVAPLFRIEYLKHWWSIESTFIADARMLAENLPHRHWQPLWYCGTRADYVYPPALRYGPALLARATGLSTARTYHLYIAVLYALGFSGLYLMARSGSRSRAWAVTATLAWALLSPVFALLPEVAQNSTWKMPQRLHVLTMYGEGPHVSSLSVLPFVFAAAAPALSGRGRHWIALAAAAAATVVSHNFYGATALAIAFPLLVWSHFVLSRDWRMPVRAMMIAALAYGMTSWWLVPSYLKITTINLQYVSQPGDTRSRVIAAALFAAYLAGTWMLARKRPGYTMERAWSWFVFSAAGAFCVYVLGYNFAKLQITGDSNRLLPEVDLFLILAAVEVLRGLAVRGRAWRYAAIAVVAGSFVFSARYLSHLYPGFPEDRDWRNRVEYKVTSWIAEHYPAARVLATGSIRFWYNTWHDITQVDGGSQQGLLNQHIVLSQWRVLVGDDMELARLWLQALGVDLAVVPEANSQEEYKDIKRTDLWRATFPILREDGEGNVFYRIPRRTPGVVRIVDAARMRGLPPIPGDAEHEQMRAYVSAIEAEPAAPDSGSRIRYQRPHPDVMDIEASLRDGEVILLQETFDPNRRAYLDGRALAMDADTMNFTLIRAPAGDHRVRVVFETPREVQAGRALTVVSLFAFLLLCVRRRHGRVI